MANCCFYDMRVVGKKKDLDRLYKIMNYDDDVFYIYRVRDIAKMGEIKPYKDDLYIMDLSGEVAWSSYDWIHSIMELRVNENKGLNFNMLYTNLRFLSGLLDLGIEWTTEENGCGFAEHYAVCKGELICEQTCDYSEPWYEVSDDESLGDMLYDIEHTYESWLKPEEMVMLIEKAKESLEKDRVFSMSIGGFKSEFNPDDIWNGEVKELKQNSYHIFE